MATIKLTALDKEIDSLGKKTAKWRDDVQVVLVKCAKLAFDHNDVSGFTRLVGVMKGSDMYCLMGWIKTHAPALWNKKDLRYNFNKSFDAEFDGIFLLGKAWYEFAREAKDVNLEIDYLARLQEFLKRSEKEVASKLRTKPVKNVDVLMEIRKAITAFTKA